MTRDVAITGMGAVCAIAADCGELWTAIELGRCGIAPIRRFDTGDFGVHTGALVAIGVESRGHDRLLTDFLCRSFAERAGREAIASAGLGEGRVDTRRIGFVFGTGLGDLRGAIHEMAEAIADVLGAHGPRMTVSTACSSSTGAIGVARDLLVMGAADVVIAGGADVLTPEVFAGFHALGVLSTGSCAPFSTPFGTTLGEGAGFVTLERSDDAAARGATPSAWLAGYGLSGDAWHETSPHPQGLGVERALRAALQDADVRAGDIDYVNVHGSGTEANDPAEWRGIQHGLGARADEIPVSSTKGALGHAQGAAGVLEAIVTILAMNRGLVPPTLNFAGKRPRSPRDPVPGPVPRPCAVHTALSLNAAFGGANAAVVLSRTRRSATRRARLPLEILGVGRAGLAEPSATNGHSSALGDVVPTADPRSLDATATMLTTAAALGLRDAGVTVAGVLRDRAGLVVGQLRASPSNFVEFERSIADRGLRNVSAVAFARVVLNAAAGSCSKVLSLRGPLTAITTGNGSGLAAVALAAEFLSQRPDVELMVAGGVDEHAVDALGGGVTADGAVCFVMGRPAGGVVSGRRAVAVSGWGFAGHGHVDDAIARATGGHGASADIDVRIDGRSFTDATCSAITCADALATAVAALQRGAARTAIVSVDAGHSMATAVYLSAA